MYKSLCILALAMLGAAIAAPAHSQTASSAATSMQGETQELRVGASLVPPSVVEQNGSLTGFSIELWNAIATSLKLKSNYQIMPDVACVWRITDFPRISNSPQTGFDTRPATREKVAWLYRGTTGLGIGSNPSAEVREGVL